MCAVISEHSWTVGFYNIPLLIFKQVVFPKFDSNVITFSRNCLYNVSMYVLLNYEKARLILLASRLAISSVSYRFATWGEYACVAEYKVTFPYCVTSLHAIRNSALIRGQWWVRWHFEYNRFGEEVFVFSQVSDMAEQSGLCCSEVLISA